MGLYDDLQSHYPLPMPGANDLSYQTKDLACLMDRYEIRADGTLWHEDYDIEDRSDPTKDGIERLYGLMTRVNQRWEAVPLTGEVQFYATLPGRQPHSGWLEWSAYFVKGVVVQLHLLRHESPETVDAVARVASQDSQASPRAEETLTSQSLTVPSPTPEDPS